MLAPGQYQIEKSLTSGVLDPATVIDTMSGQTYEQVEEDTLSARYKRTAGIYLDSVYYYLQHSKMTKLYNYLHVNTSVNNPDSVFADSSVAFNIGCSKIRIPVRVCAKNSCTTVNIDFEGYFKKQWADSSQFWTPTGTGYLPYLNTYPDNFQHGQFNWLISHMVAAGYNCDTLWTCWQSLVAEYPTLKNSTYGKYKFDMLQAFLNCTGREYKGTMHSASDTAKYIGYAFEYFLYNNNNTTCNSILKNAYGDTSTRHQDTLHGQLSNKKWQQYYYCIWNVDSTPTTRNNDTTSDIAAAQCNCISVCEGRYQGFIQSLIQMYHNDSIYVQGDKYYLKKDTFNDGNVYVPGPSNDTLPHTFSNYKTMASIECAARDHVL